MHQFGGRSGSPRARFLPYNMRLFSSFANALAGRIAGCSTQRLSYAPKKNFERATKERTGKKLPSSETGAPCGHEFFSPGDPDIR
jgi:hypothetical protein